MRSPPPPGLIERLYRVGVGLAIPLTLVAGVVLLLTAREQQSAAPGPGTAPPVLMAEPLDQPRPTVELRAAPKDCKPDARHPCAETAGIRR